MSVARTFHRLTLALSVAAGVSLLASCGPSNGLNLARVRGKVTFQGQPIKNGTVFFMPDEAKGTVGPPAVGSIVADGTFIMSTETAGDGVIVGNHMVGITGVEEGPSAEGEAAPDPQSDPANYMKAKAKAAAATRKAARPAEFFTDRSGQRFRFVIPQKLSNPQESGIIAKVESGSNTFNFEIDESGRVLVNR
jgi:hypothetical protein